MTDLLSDLRALMTGMALATPPVTRCPAIAVLPFANLTNDPDQEYFCDGMAEELISALSRVKGLAVVSRTSAFQFKGSPIDVREIGERLDVQTVLEGSVRRAGNRLRDQRTARQRVRRLSHLVRAVRPDHRRRLPDPGRDRAIDHRVAAGDADQAGDRHHGQAGDDESGRLPPDLRGRFLLNKFADLYGSLTGARRCFEEAVALDPMYSAAYAGLSEACTALGYTTFLPAPEASRAALEAAERAVTLDASLPEGHTALGWTKTLFAIDMRTAERDFQRALEIAPGYAPAHGYYALLLCGFGRSDEAIDHAMQARHTIRSG